ncbi:IclR family transcriptional regulator [Natrinema salsiterrestre]|uniref:IclR family transcriptional regulator n=1 Tax=Natrinema salsiterrestre TaxID=2950540 RepID=A0A9Q4Q3R8_9EURY|nr:IclR family transcriptional regulator [Natrinema salsiterrestre]MDF9747841.1 IclR family transcriptional regulator [Natrinema salsiterrestre]
MAKDKDGSGTGNRINAVENAFTMIERMQELEQCGVSELAADLDIPKSTAHVYLKTLEELGYVIKENGQYRLSMRFLELGGLVRHNRSIYQAARSEVDALSRTTGEVGTIGYVEDGMRVLVYRTEPVEGVSDNAPTGEFTEMHWTAVGKVLLAQRTDEEIRDVVDRHGLPAATENTITDLDELLKEAAEIRTQGYSIEDEERVSGIKSIAVPIDSNGSDSGNSAISIAGPKHRFSTERVEEELLPELRNVANVIELQSRHY